MSDSDFEEGTGGGARPRPALSALPAQKRQQTTQASLSKRTSASGSLDRARPKPSKPASRPKPQRPPQPAPLKQQGRRPPPPPTGSDSEDDFLEGTLVQAVPAAEPEPEPEAPAAKAAGKKRKRQVAAAPAGGGAGEGGTVTVWTLDAAADGRSAGQQQVAVHRLQRGQELSLGWGRPVAAYRPPQPLADVERADRRVLTFPDAAALLAYDLAALGGGFQGVLINAQLLESAADAAAEGGAGGVTTTQLAALALGACVGSDGVLAVWAPKERLAEVAGLMRGWGFRYAENLTWVQLGPNGHVAEAASPHARRSHLTLLMGRKGSRELELRHQRTVDVVLAPALAAGRAPGEARAMVETLLPASAGYLAGGRPRLLEVALCGAEAGGRAGWVTLTPRDPLPGAAG